MRAALNILDDSGLPELTMRRLAAALEVQASALYWHFTNKQTLLAELADRIVGRASELGPAASADPASGIHPVLAEARALRDALLSYRDGAELVSSSLALGLGGFAARERLAAAILASGTDPADAGRAARALLHFVLGQVSVEQQRLQYDSLGVLSEPLAPAERQGAAESESIELDADPSAEFSYGVELFVAGLRSQQHAE